MSLKFFPDDLSLALDVNNLSAAYLESLGLYFTRMEISEQLFTILKNYYYARGVFWLTSEREYSEHCFNNVYCAPDFMLTQIIKYKYKKKFYLDPLFNSKDLNRKIKSILIKPSKIELKKLDLISMVGNKSDGIYHLLSAVISKFRDELIRCNIYKNKELHAELTKLDYLDFFSPQYTAEYHQQIRDSEIAEMLRRDKEFEIKENKV